MTPHSASAANHRVLALDPGGKRTGVAISDELGIFAHPRPALVTASRTEAAASVARLVETEGVTEVVVGLPVGLSGAMSAQTDDVTAFVRLLRETLSIPVTTWDERLSSVEASRPLRGATKGEQLSQTRGGKAARATGELDSRSAAIVLQAVLDSRRGAIR